MTILLYSLPLPNSTAMTDFSSQVKLLIKRCTHMRQCILCIDVNSFQYSLCLSSIFFPDTKHFCREVGKRMFIFPTDSCSHMISSIPLWLLILFSNIYSPAVLGCTKSPLSFQIYGRNKQKKKLAAQNIHSSSKI